MLDLLYKVLKHVYFDRKLVQHVGGLDLMPSICLKVHPNMGGETVLQLRTLALVKDPGTQHSS